MIDQGAWILAIIIYGSRFEISLLPYEVFPNQTVCEAWKGRESKELKLPMTCIREGEA